MGNVWNYLLEIYSQVGLVGAMKFSNFNTWIILFLWILEADYSLKAVIFLHLVFLCSN